MPLPVFEVKTVSGWLNPRRLSYCNSRVAGAVCPDLDRYHELLALLRDYRNLLVHDRPIFLQNDWLPRPECAFEYSGLTAIGKLVKDPAALTGHSVPAGDTLTRILGLLTAFAQELIVFSTAHLDALADTEYPKDQSRVTKGDHKLSLANFKRMRSV